MNDDNKHTESDDASPCEACYRDSKIHTCLRGDKLKKVEPEETAWQSPTWDEP